jgi:hypothetical protein
MSSVLCYFGLHRWSTWERAARHVPFNRRECRHCGKHDIAPTHMGF